MTQRKIDRKGESGNVLFLILIAVALFAALSYAVTQSTRSGSGSTDRETTALNSATLTQYPTALRTAVVRMILSGNDMDDIGFDVPGSTGYNAASTESLVFHPDGGGAVYQTASQDPVVAGASGRWYINGNFEIPDIGQDNNALSNDVIAFLPLVTLGVCNKINSEFGVDTSGDPPDFDATNASITDDHEVADTFPTGPGEIITTAEFAGNPTGCFEDANINGGSTGYVLYVVIMER